jgi:hypothetical protein
MTEAEKKLIDAAMRGVDGEEYANLAGAVMAERVDLKFRERIVDIDRRQAAIHHERQNWFAELSARMGGATGDVLMAAAREILEK